MSKTHCNAKNPATCRYHHPETDRVQNIDTQIKQALRNSDYNNYEKLTNQRKQLVEEQRITINENGAQGTNDYAPANQKKIFFTNKALTFTSVSNIKLSEPLQKQLNDKGYSTPTLYELPSNKVEAFHAVMQSFKTPKNKYHASVHVHSLEEYRTMRCFVSDDGKCGMAVQPDGEIVSVFSTDKATHPNVAQSLMLSGVIANGNKLNCFDTVLPEIYRSSGFVETERMTWDDQYTPEGWDFKTYEKFNGGRPDVIDMEFSHFDIEALPNKK